METICTYHSTYVVICGARRAVRGGSVLVPPLRRCVFRAVLIFKAPKEKCKGKEISNS